MKKPIIFTLLSLSTLFFSQSSLAGNGGIGGGPSSVSLDIAEQVQSKVKYIQFQKCSGDEINEHATVCTISTYKNRWKSMEAFLTSKAQTMGPSFCLTLGQGDGVYVPCTAETNKMLPKILIEADAKLRTNQ